MTCLCTKFLFLALFHGFSSNDFGFSAFLPKEKSAENKAEAERVRAATTWVHTVLIPSYAKRLIQREKSGLDNLLGIASNPDKPVPLPPLSSVPKNRPEQRAFFCLRRIKVCFWHCRVSENPLLLVLFLIFDF